jgi:hypothetical protein
MRCAERGEASVDELQFVTGVKDRHELFADGILDPNATAPAFYDYGDAPTADPEKAAVIDLPRMDSFADYPATASSKTADGTHMDLPRMDTFQGRTAALRGGARPHARSAPFNTATYNEALRRGAPLLPGTNIPRLYSLPPAAEDNDGCASM